jgi:hypothetical protein|tara:strand:+ start:351 stop:545 length:195 start_codon:yes stop_codon:yes gene_type:complete
MGSAAGEEFVSLKEEKEEEGLDFVYIMCVDVTKSNKIIRPCVSKLSFVLLLSKRKYFLNDERKT